ncbi:NUDIX domain-containing protein [Streptomyces specialis]|uniref:NUDIX domain-containing protein n=1 Tax=Streptomyces specialis TaxID=498367 RepID=UPI00073F7CBC|nr:NUDIX domain-containing protein [Streptomyces specialis]
MSTTRTVKVSILVLAGGDQYGVLQLRHPGSPDWDLPGGLVHEGQLILERGAQLLAEQTGLRRTVMRAVALDQTPRNPQTHQPETLTYVLAGGYAEPGALTPAAPMRWAELPDIMHAEGITKYAVASALYTGGGKALPVCLGGEALYTEADHRRAEQLKQAHERGEWTPGTPPPTHL